MARKNTLNRYLAGTPYAVLSMEALEDDAIENIQLSLENELVKVNALTEQLAKINRQKGMTREIALSLESIDDAILPFKPVGFTAFPSKTGLTLTQESLGKAISEGFKRAMTFLLELLKRFGALLTATVGLAPRAKVVVKETNEIVVGYRNLKEVANVIIDGDQGDKTTFNFNDRDYLSLIMQADTLSFFVQVAHRWNAYCRKDLVAIQAVLRNFSNPNKAYVEQIAESAEEQAETMAKSMSREHITANPSDDLNTFKKNYFDSIEAFVTPLKARAERYTAKDFAKKFADSAALLEMHSAEFATNAEAFSKANQDIQRQIGRLMSTATEVEHEIFTNMNKVITVHTRMVAVLATHLSYLVQTHEAYTRKARADLERAKTEGDA